MRIQESRAIEFSARSSLARSKHESSSIELSKSKECRDNEQLLRKRERKREAHDSAARSKAFEKIDNV